MKGEVPEERYTVPFGVARVVQEGDDVTVVALGQMVGFAQKAIGLLDGVSVELIDPRTTSPFDDEAVLRSVEKTGRLVIVDESSPRCGMAADIASLVATKGFNFLKAPIINVTPPHTPVPFATPLERYYLPSPERIADAISRLASTKENV